MGPASFCKRRAYFFEEIYTQAIETNAGAHSIVGAEALLRFNPNSLSSFPSDDTLYHLTDVCGEATTTLLRVCC